METKEIRRANLRALIKEFADKGVNRAKFAEMIGIPAAQLSQIGSDNPTRNIGDIIARRIEESLNLRNGWMDNIHAAASESDSIKDNFILHNIGDNNTVQTYRISQLDLEYSCGGGRLNSEYPDIVKAVEIDPDYAKKMFGGRKASSLGLVTAVGDSMLGTIDPGSLVVLDVTVRSFLSDGIYAFTFGDTMHIKRLQSMGNKMMVISDNSVYEKWEINETNESELHIEGFVVGKWEMNYTRLG
ncbi:S24 family peptidase [Morganella morganii]|uniref:S24 family peptidase n=1 Tax=Morganella morganii TaxID=582 RepID=UPI000BD5EBEC|nr:S24 family peptidase [Morganella morganii]EJD6109766.1 helix-turn-helix transcriptional regulator [Morganella morganii]EKU4014381.1 helix-turn-helix transcriptional regulator [Morganella morganii]EKU5841115.1 helix-turn-helix transcriptional regulator [Morganella morganii]ELA7703663.1 helix-turn-helix transcriptional regulator [Morganella morganii]MBT0353075.1 helix-turn-helix transcriptional regulator [Morganella morganii subsp. morganii]